jgi:DNA-binding winged helix-turn-helix (wHTH) protein
LAGTSGFLEIVRERPVPLRFGDFVFDGAARDVSRVLSPKAFQLLEALVAERPRALSRAELNDRLWPRTSMGYTSLAGAVAELRRALGDHPREPQFLRTVHGFGYAFCGVAQEEPHARQAAFACALSWEDREIGLVEGVNTIGRIEACTVRIDSLRVSRVHARIVVRGEHASVEDLGSKNGTFLRGQRLSGARDLEDGDEIGIGGACLTFRASRGHGSTLTA